MSRLPIDTPTNGRWIAATGKAQHYFYDYGNHALALCRTGAMYSDLHESDLPKCKRCLSIEKNGPVWGRE